MVPVFRCVCRYVDVGWCVVCFLCLSEKPMVEVGFRRDICICVLGGGVYEARVRAKVA